MFSNQFLRFTYHPNFAFQSAQPRDVMAPLPAQHPGIRRKEIISLEPISIERAISPGVELGLKMKSNIFQQRILAGTHLIIARKILSEWPGEVIGLDHSASL